MMTGYVRVLGASSLLMSLLPAAPEVPSAHRDGWTKRGDENDSGAFADTRSIRYGANAVDKTVRFTGPVVCSSAVFGGDSIPSVLQRCDVGPLPHAAPSGPRIVFALPPVPSATPLSPTLPTAAPVPSSVVQRAIFDGGKSDICWKDLRGQGTAVDCTSAFPANCGAACGVSDSACALVILDRVQSSSELTLNVTSLIASAGTVAPLLRAAQTAGRAAKPTLTRAARDRLRRQAKAHLDNALRWQRRSETIDRSKGWLDDASNLNQA